MDEATRAIHLRAGEAYGQERTCGTKVKFPEEASALRMAVRLNARDSWRKPHDVEPYPCFWCNQWHVGRVMTPEEILQFSV